MSTVDIRDHIKGVVVCMQKPCEHSLALFVLACKEKKGLSTR